MRILLTVTGGPFAGRIFGFTSHDTFLVGRSKHTHLRLPPDDRTCSRVHFMIEVNPPHCRLVDMGSRNGTRVNNRRVDKVVELKHGDKIRAGRNVLRIAVQAASAPNRPDADAKRVAAPPTTVSELQPLPEAIPLSHLLPPGTSLPVGVPERELPPPPRRVQGQGDKGTRGQGEKMQEGLTAAQEPRMVPLSPCPLVPLSLPPVPPSPPTSNQPGGSLNSRGYTLGQKLGEGAMGAVYLVKASDGRLMAVKMIRTTDEVSQEDVERFLREAAILRDLRHPNIVGFQEIGVDAGRPYFVMEYVPGQDAGTLLKEQGPLPPARAVALTCQLLEALEYAHARRFVHRDVKPGNLLVYKEDGRELLKVADFGLARVYQASKLSGLTMDGHVGGTPYFMAPEQLLHFRDAPPAADQYSAAATLYSLLTCKFLYEKPADVYMIFAKILNEDPVPIRQRRAEIAVGLAEVIHRALHRDPENRFGNVALLRKALEPFGQPDAASGKRR